MTAIAGAERPAVSEALRTLAARLRREAEAAEIVPWPQQPDFESPVTRRANAPLSAPSGTNH